MSGEVKPFSKLCSRRHIKKMNKRDLIFGIALSDDEIDDCYLKSVSEDNNISKRDVKKLKMAHLFLLSDNVRFSQFDADIVLFDEKGIYYHTGDAEPINRVENKDIVALVDVNGEVELV